MALKLASLAISLLVSCSVMAETKSITVYCPGADDTNKIFASQSFISDSQHVGWVMNIQSTNDFDKNSWPNSDWKGWQAVTGNFYKEYGDDAAISPHIECFVGKTQNTSSVTGFLPLHDYTSCILGASRVLVNADRTNCAPADSCPLTCTYTD